MGLEFTTFTIPPGIAPIFIGLDFMLAENSCYPGAPVGYAWKVRLPSNVRWLSADLEMVLVSDKSEQQLWTRTGMRWPPRAATFEDSDGIWPPVGFVAAELRLIGSARNLLYSGFGPKNIRFKVTGHDAGGNSRTLSADETLTVVAQPHPLAAAITSPANAAWGSHYNLHGTFANPTFTQVNGQAVVTASDRTSFPPVPISIGPSSAESLTVAGPIAQTWQWNDHPAYNVHDDQLSRRFAYSLTVGSIQDEFGNPYPDVVVAPWTVTVRVSGTKVDAAHEVEQDFVANVAFTICSIVAGFFGEVAAVLAGGCATAAALVSVDVAQWSQIADDPPEPDHDFWTVLPLPEPFVLPDKDDLAAVNRLLALSCRMGQLLRIGLATAGKIMGARLAAAGVAEAVQQQCLQKVIAEIQNGLSQLPVLTPAAIDTAEKHVDLSSAKAKALLAKWSSQGVSADEAKTISQLHGPEAGANLIKFLSQPNAVSSLEVPDIVASMAVIVLRAAGDGLQELMDTLAVRVTAGSSTVGSTA